MDIEAPCLEGRPLRPVRPHCGLDYRGPFWGLLEVLEFGVSPVAIYPMMRVYAACQVSRGFDSGRLLP